MHYFDYLCGIYRICLQPPAKLKSFDDQTKFHQQTPKFYDYSNQPIGDTFLSAAGFNVFKPNAKSDSTITEQIKSTDKLSNDNSVIVPKTCTGDWLLRYTQNETNFNPWQAKFSHFELVPWRQQNKRIDLINAIGWEPFDASATNQQQLRTVQKFELARSKRLRKQQLKKQRDHFRRQIKIRFILSLEVRQRAMKMKRRIQPNVVMQTTQQRKLVLQRDRQMIVFDERAYDLSTHWGYFSQRHRGVEERCVGDDKGDLKAIEMNRSESAASTQSTARLSSSSKAQSESSDKSNSSGLLVSCEKCRRRCVLYDYAI